MVGGSGGRCGAQWEEISANLDAMAPKTVSCPGWHLEESSGPAGVFHDRPLPDPVIPSVWIHHIDAPALVLGSTQDDEILNPRAVQESGIEVCRRRSGGGLVSLEPTNDLWIDVLIPPSSRLWSDDVGKAFGWVGETWARALRETLTTQAGAAPTMVSVHDGPLLEREAGRLICFAGLGPGEVTVEGRKVVGLSQRRTRSGARFQCAMTWRWRPAGLAQFVNQAVLDEADIVLEQLDIGLPPGADGTAAKPSISTVIDAFLRQLPSP